VVTCDGVANSCTCNVQTIVTISNSIANTPRILYFIGDIRGYRVGDLMNYLL
jgi:hypothetical protein